MTRSPLDWTDEGQPRSRLFGDVYFSAEDGLAETRAVFLEGCGLPGGWAGRRRFVVGELGFGTGLNIAALLELWRRTRPAEGRLHVFTVEGYPISAEEAARALAGWPELADVAKALASRWPGRAGGIHRMELPDFAAVVDVSVGDVTEALSGWTGRADAWFLDGFSPALNPQMWSDEVLALVGARSAPGARAATFTVAGQVRRGLAAAGFEVEKRPGFGRKRERLEARLPGQAREADARRVAIIGAGVAGAAAARAVRALGGEAVVLEAEAPGSGGSGNPAALVTPRLDAGLAAPARLFARAFARAVALYGELPEAIVTTGVLQLAMMDRDPARFAKIASSDLFEPGSLNLLTSEQATARLSEPAPSALDQRSALVVEPARVLEAWLGPMERGAVADVKALDADAVIVAAGLGARELLDGLSLQPVRGQASWAAGVPWTAAAAWGGYVVPTRDGVLFGATHDRDDVETGLRPDDHARNLATLGRALPGLAGRLAHAPLEGRAAVRAATRDRLPIAGPAATPGVFALTGFGSRGFSMAPLLAEHVAALAMGAPSPLTAEAQVLIDPARFRSPEVP
ncbi:tRNA (5-methylaminomethyl-2-thiouridine)(34)-methyltransferase MnmD [Phenylobacterium sp. VNQ135]|uniref:tRNA (5-methylaminomethyl-2-thiouridine)(34)-methyltransferase MnmD n=1 Tax=Phenylobacterium sp. VNQ135 TaxID=3400922 RepID=UPI003BFD117D